MALFPKPLLMSDGPGELRVPEERIKALGPHGILLVKEALKMEAKQQNVDVIVADEFVDGTLHIAWVPDETLDDDPTAPPT